MQAALPRSTRPMRRGRETRSLPIRHDSLAVRGCGVPRLLACLWVRAGPPGLPVSALRARDTVISFSLLGGSLIFSSFSFLFLLICLR